MGLIIGCGDDRGAATIALRGFRRREVGETDHRFLAHGKNRGKGASMVRAVEAAYAAILNGSRHFAGTLPTSGDVGYKYVTVIHGCNQNAPVATARGSDKPNTYLAALYLTDQTISSPVPSLPTGRSTL